jgi:hypothetical protein
MQRRSPRRSQFTVLEAGRIVSVGPSDMQFAELSGLGDHT